MSLRETYLAGAGAVRQMMIAQAIANAGGGGSGPVFDGSSTSGVTITPSNANKTVSFTGDGTSSPVIGAIVSTATKNAGKWFGRFKINAIDGTAATSVCLGIAGPSFDVNNIMATIGDAFTINANGGVGHYTFGPGGTPQDAGTGPNPATNDEVIVYFDCDAHTFGVVTPDNVQHAMTGSLPTEAFKLVSFCIINGVSATVGASLLTSGSLTAPAGYTDITAGGGGSTVVNGSAITVQDLTDNAAVILNASAGTGTTPTLDVKLQHTPDNGTTWNDIPGAVFQTVTGTASIQQFALAVGQTSGSVRAVASCSGTTAGFTFSLSLLGLRK